MKWNIWNVSRFKYIITIRISVKLQLDTAPMSVLIWGKICWVKVIQYECFCAHLSAYTYRTVSFNNIQISISLYKYLNNSYNIYSTIYAKESQSNQDYMNMFMFVQITFRWKLSVLYKLLTVIYIQWEFHARTPIRLNPPPRNTTKQS